MTTLFISDLHLSTSSPELTSNFLRFMTEQVVSAEALYILGDFFEAWVGDDNNELFVTDIVNVLKKCSMKTKIYIMNGNRDFLLGNAFAKKCGATLLQDPTVIDLYGTQTLLTHGDLLCTEDKAYQYWRRIVHYRWLQNLFLMLPLPGRLKIAERLRVRSKKYVKSLNATSMDVVVKSLLAMMRHYNVDQLIHGHTHQPAIHYLQLDNKPAWHYVLSDWHNTATALVCKPSAPPQLLPAL